MALKKEQGQDGRIERAIADARRNREQRDQSYREQALKMYPWVCGRCRREFTRANVIELTVHHRDHNHDNNPEDGSNWELLCLYCHDAEHAHHDAGGAVRAGRGQEHPHSTFKPFAGLDHLLGKDK